MRKYLLITVAVFTAFISFAQSWTANLPEKEKGEAFTFFDYQNAFYNYWEPFGVVDGYYFDENNEKQKAPAWKQFKRWEYFWESRVHPATGKFPSVDLADVYKEYILHVQNSRSSTGDWTSMGPSESPGGYAGIGRLNCISFHPTDENVFWVGAPAGGIWGTDDGGSTWEILNDYENVIGVSHIAIPSDYSTSSTIYIATGDRDHWDNRSIGVLKSTDGGVTWNSTGLSFTVDEGENTYRLLMDPDDDETIVAATTAGIYKTTDGADNWSFLSDHSFIDLEYKPGDYSTLYGSTTSGEIYRSTNGGSTWTLSHNEGNRIELTVTPDEPDWVYAVVANSSSGLYGVYQSTDAGETFTMVYDGDQSGHNLLGWSSSGGGTTGQGWYDLSLAASLTNGNTIYVGGVNTWRSTNGGTTFQLVNHWYGDGVQAVHADKHALKYNEFNNELYEVNDGGVYNTANGTSWTHLSDGLVISQIYRLGTSKTHSDETIIGLQDNGSKLTHNNGAWDDVKGGDGMECIIDYSDVDIQYGTYVNGQISRTTDHWDHSTDISANIPGGPAGAWVTPYLIDPENPLILYVGYTDVWKTNNRGNSFTKIGDFSGNKLRSMAICQTDPDYIFIATYSIIRKTENGGANWTDITNNLPIGSASIKYIAVKDDDPETIWVAMSSYAGYGVYESENGGTSWTNISDGLPEIPVNTIVCNKLNNSEEELYAGTDAGVYLKIGANDWTPFSLGLANVVVDELEIYYDENPENSMIRAATFGRGLWESDLYSNDGLEASISVTPGCFEGTVTVGSNQDGLQTFYLTDIDGVVLEEVTVENTYYEFIDRTDGFYRGKVTKDDVTSELTNEVELINLDIPLQPEEIFGPDTVCEGSTETYSVEPVSSEELTYTWTLPEGWTGESTTDNIVVTIGSTDGTVEVFASNACGDGQPQSAEIEVLNLPENAGDIAGDYQVCIGEEGLIYTVTEIAFADYYIWSLPVGVEITDGDSTNQITVTITEDATNGGMNVYGVNDCGAGEESADLFIQVNSAPAVPGEINGPDLIFNPEELTEYSVEEIAGTDIYNWILDPTWTLSSGSGTNQIEIQFGANAAEGILQVNTENYCGISENSSKQIDVIYVGIDELSNSDILIYPNPSKGIVHITLPETPVQSTEILVKNLTGKTVYHSKSIQEKLIEVDLSDLPAGVYLLQLRVENILTTRRIVVEK